MGEHRVLVSTPMITLKVFRIKTHETPFFNILIHRWVGFFRKFNLPLTLQIQLLRQKFVIEVSVLSKNISANALQTNSTVKDCIVKGF